VSDAGHFWQCFLQQRRFVTVARCRNKRNDDITVAIPKGHSVNAEGHHFVAFEMFVSTESEIVTALLRHCRCPIAVDDADVEQVLLVKLQDRTRENGIEASMNFKTSKGSIDPGIVDLRLPLFVLFDGQFFPLTAQVQQFQNIVEDRVQREFRLRSTTAKVSVGQDKFFKLFQGQMRGNCLPLLGLSHDYSIRTSN
jgi:hypothetical protein